MSRLRPDPKKGEAYFPKVSNYFDFYIHHCALTNGQRSAINFVLTHQIKDIVRHSRAQACSILVVLIVYNLINLFAPPVKDSELGRLEQLDVSDMKILVELVTVWRDDVG